MSGKTLSSSGLRADPDADEGRRTEPLGVEGNEAFRGEVAKCCCCSLCFAGVSPGVPAAFASCLTGVLGKPASLARRAATNLGSTPSGPPMAVAASPSRAPPSDLARRCALLEKDDDEIEFRIRLDACGPPVAVPVMEPCQDEGGEVLPVDECDSDTAESGCCWITGLSPLALDPVVDPDTDRLEVPRPRKFSSLPPDGCLAPVVMDRFLADGYAALSWSPCPGPMEIVFSESPSPDRTELPPLLLRGIDSGGPMMPDTFLLAPGAPAVDDGVDDGGDIGESAADKSFWSEGDETDDDEEAVEGAKRDEVAAAFCRLLVSCLSHKSLARAEVERSLLNEEEATPMVFVGETERCSLSASPSAPTIDWRGRGTCSAGASRSKSSACSCSCSSLGSVEA